MAFTCANVTWRYEVMSCDKTTWWCWLWCRRRHWYLLMKWYGRCSQCIYHCQWVLQFLITFSNPFVSKLVLDFLRRIHTRYKVAHHSTSVLGYIRRKIIVCKYFLFLWLQVDLVTWLYVACLFGLLSWFTAIVYVISRCCASR